MSLVRGEVEDWGKEKKKGAEKGDEEQRKTMRECKMEGSTREKKYEERRSEDGRLGERIISERRAGKKGRNKGTDHDGPYNGSVKAGCLFLAGVASVSSC